MEADWCVCCVCVRAGRMRRHLDELMSCWDGEEEEEKKTVPFIFPCIYLPLKENKEKNTEYIYIYRNLLKQKKRTKKEEEEGKTEEKKKPGA